MPESEIAQGGIELPNMLGPFLGEVTTSSIKIWLHLEGPENAYVTVHEQPGADAAASNVLNFNSQNLFSDCVKISNLKPDTKYFYRLWSNSAHSIPLFLQGLGDNDLHFFTLSDDENAQIDFLLLSCHNPTVTKNDGYDGHAVWADIPQIIANESNKNVRFALMVGDQVYADAWQERLLAESDDKKRLNLYLEVYRAFWSNIHYRRVLCSLPAMMIWDDHDITDGWGSTIESFEKDSSEFKEEWKRLFKSASTAFTTMQASRNPLPLSNNSADGFGFCFRIGKWGFIVLDLRSNRNLKKRQLMTAAQSHQMRKWIDDNRDHLDSIFVISSVVFSHGSSVIDDIGVRIWPLVMNAVDWFARLTKWGKGVRTKFSKSLGDIRDDIRDSWGVPENASQADEILDYLFELQNHPHQPLGVVILSGDIHTSGYANIYSSDVNHKTRSSIPHITSSSVSYSPFNWLMEAVYRNASKTVGLGSKGIYCSQISHHFCSRSVAVLSIRPLAGGHQLKVKYYLEGYPEPQILIFDLSRSSHRENIAWVAQERLFDKDYSPSVTIDVESQLRDRAKAMKEKLNWQESIVDLLKLLNLDSSLGARKRLAQQLGYDGTLNGSAEMNIWLHKKVIEKYIQHEGNVAQAFH